MLGHDFNSWGVETRMGFDSSSPASRGLRCARVWMDARRVVHCVAAALLARHALSGHRSLHGPTRCWHGAGAQHVSRHARSSLAEKLHGAWRHAGVRFLLSGELRRAMRTCLDGRPPSSPLRCCSAPRGVARARSPLRSVRPKPPGPMPDFSNMAAGVSRAGART